ncbi:formate dehydrogenase accessory sulfurtransferase FdhD [Paracoccus sp. AS002]|uniref:formate dehydrogenase accessory sulfurtransferase FdhD n=1 Tax=Paracoccus sp. AS002 TaxID=3019545 RepID=UPI0023E7BCD0|nr:formate dehydrogenase accessory sulfurtransferase FdhD [Paracoccus sp. AS002]MDF3904944.1 formate dehydrogenase accessory sulfurtransferase FdhD [Paracoccus sp. AS002]
MRDVKAGVLRWDGEGQGGGWRPIEPPPAPQECPVAIVIDGMSQAVLMATPHDLHDFALGFALTEGLVAAPEDVEGFEEAEVSAGGFPAREARLWLRPGLAARLAERRRSMIGPVGCGLCGVDSIEAALPRIVPVASDWSMPPADVARAMAALTQGQVLRHRTPAIHGAAFWDGAHGLTREDVGRHNALDKLAGALALAGLAAGQGAIVMSSRLSVDLVQKAARIGAPILIGASAPTALALEWAERAGITLIARARGASFDLYTHPRRIAGS